jgi:hypothetical protein
MGGAKLAWDDFVLRTANSPASLAGHLPGLPGAYATYRTHRRIYCALYLVQHHREKCPFSCLLRELRTSRTMDTN